MKTVRDKIRQGVYEVPDGPARSDFAIEEVVETKRLGKQVLKGFDEQGYKEACERHRSDRNARNLRFKHDCLVEVGLVELDLLGGYLYQHSKAELCWKLAEEMTDDESQYYTIYVL